MTIKLVNQGNKATVLLDGRLDSTTAPDTEKIFMQAAEKFDTVTLDLADMEYISSAGLRTFKKLHMAMKKKNGELTVRNVNSLVMEVFEMTGFVALFKFE